MRSRASGYGSRRPMSFDDQKKALFAFETQFGGENAVTNAVKKAKRLMNSKLEKNLEGSDNVFVPWGYSIGQAVAEHLSTRPLVQNIRNLISETEIMCGQAAFMEDDEEYIDELLSESFLFGACLVLRELSSQLARVRRNELAEVALFVLRHHDDRHALLQIFDNSQADTSVFKSLCLVAKVPKIGRSKTRLGATIGNDEALAFAKASLFDLCERLSGIGNGVEKCLVFAPKEEEDELRSMLDFELDENISSLWHLEPFITLDNFEEEKKVGFAFDNNELVGLGRGLARCLQRKMTEHPRGVVCFIGMDAPHMPTELILNSLNMTVSPCILPALDGGYTLLSVPFDNRRLKVDPITVFSSIQWSCTSTFAYQAIALQRAGFKSIEIVPTVMRDVDEHDDLIALRNLLRGDTILSRLCPRVAEFLNANIN